MTSTYYLDQLQPVVTDVAVLVPAEDNDISHRTNRELKDDFLRHLSRG